MRTLVLARFRATYLTNMLHAGIDPHTVMSYSGHSDIETLMRYLSPAELPETQEKVNAINFGVSEMATKGPGSSPGLCVYAAACCFRSHAAMAKEAKRRAPPTRKCRSDCETPANRCACRLRRAHQRP